MNQEERMDQWIKEFRQWGIIRQALSQWRGEQFAYWEKMGYTWEEIERVLRCQVSEFESLLIERIMEFLEAEFFDRDSSTRHPEESTRRILECGVWMGSLTIPLFQAANNRGYEFNAIDSLPGALEYTREALRSAEAAVQDIERIRNGKAESLPYNDASMWLVIWGRLGQHLTREIDSEKSQWFRALQEVKRVLRPGGYFLLYEAMIPFNKQRDEAEKWRTWLRSQGDYEKALAPLYMIKAKNVPFIVETETIILWKKPLPEQEAVTTQEMEVEATTEKIEAN